MRGHDADGLERPRDVAAARREAEEDGGEEEGDGDAEDADDTDNAEEPLPEGPPREDPRERDDTHDERRDPRRAGEGEKQGGTEKDEQEHYVFRFSTMLVFRLPVRGIHRKTRNENVRKTGSLHQ